MSRWEFRYVPFKFQLSDWTIFSISIALQVRSVKLAEDSAIVDAVHIPDDVLMEGSQGYLVRSMPIRTALPEVSLIQNFLCYVPLQYPHCYIDLSGSFDDYQRKFSSKTRATINRKVKKYTEYCGGSLHWKTYIAPDQISEFFRFAQDVSKLTYQERLLGVGIPHNDDFIREASLLAADQRLRAYVLFDGEKPVAYLYCPVHNNVLVYAYLGYHPAYAAMSVGTILQWVAIKQLFEERRFRYFDFTEGQSDHKRLFATHQRLSANVFLIRRSIRSVAIVYSHLAMNRFAKWLGNKLSELGLRAKVRRWLRFGANKKELRV